MSERFRHEDIASVPAGWKVRTVTTSGGHRVRVAFPPGRRVKGAGRLVSILHPLSGSNPCGNPCTLRSSNPQELIVMGANPPRGRMETANPSNPGYYSEKIDRGSDRVVIWANTEAGPFHVQPYVNVTGPHDATAITERGKYKTLQRARKKAQAWLDEKKNPANAVRMTIEHDPSQRQFRASMPHPSGGSWLYAWGHTKKQAAAALREEWRKARGSSRNPHELLIMGANPRVEVVHGENPPVEYIHEEFTGQEVKWKDIYNEPHMPAGRYAELGPLIALYVKPVKGGPVLRIGAPESRMTDFADYWDNKPPIIVTDSTARQIYFVDGCQDISALIEQFGAVRPLVRHEANRWILGQVRRIDYQCRKEHVAHPEEDLWKHDHGEEDGQLPTLVFDQSAKRLLYEGGNYRIEGPWIRN